MASSGWINTLLFSPLRGHTQGRPHRVLSGFLKNQKEVGHAVENRRICLLTFAPPVCHIDTGSS